MIVLQIGANDDPHFADTVLSCVQAWANPFAKSCAGGSCLRGADGNLHAVAGITAPTVRAAAVS
jgi:hypothetical protein